MRQRKKTNKNEYASARHYVALGSHLQEMRQLAGLTQAQVARELGYSSAQFISNFERGLSSPPLGKLQVLIRLYRLSVDRVMDLILAGEREILEAALLSAPGRRAKAKKSR